MGELILASMSPILTESNAQAGIFQKNQSNSCLETSTELEASSRSDMDIVRRVIVTGAAALLILQVKPPKGFYRIDMKF